MLNRICRFFELHAIANYFASTTRRRRKLSSKDWNLDASRSPTRPAHPVPALALKGPNVAPKWCQHIAKNLPNRAKMRSRGPKMEPKWRQDGIKTAKKSKKNANASNNRAGPHSVAPLEPKKWPTWSQLGCQNGAKLTNKSIRKSIIFLMPLGIGFWDGFLFFGYQNGHKFVPTWDPKKISTLKAETN